MNDVLGYAGRLTAAKTTKEAAELFKATYKRYPNQFRTNMGMVSTLSSEGNYNEAIKYANAALPLAPDAGNMATVEKAIEKLKAGKDMNE
jgi:hypothetical protein